MPDNKEEALVLVPEKPFVISSEPCKQGSDSPPPPPTLICKFLTIKLVILVIDADLVRKYIWCYIAGKGLTRPGSQLFLLVIVACTRLLYIQMLTRYARWLSLQTFFHKFNSYWPNMGDSKMPEPTFKVFCFADGLSHP